MNRRIFSEKIITGAMSYAFLDSLFATNALCKAIEPMVKHWAIRLQEYCADLRKNSITVLEWQHHIEALYDQVNLEELLKFIDFDRLVKGFEMPDLGVNTRQIKFPGLEGLPEKTSFVKKIFGMKKDRAIIPHGHSNMSSAHLVIKGEMHLRHYEKIRQEKDHLIIKPTIDKNIGPGESSSISEEKDNVHWFVANTESAFTFDIIMLDLNGKPYDIHNIDIYKKEKLNDDLLRVPVLEVETALKKYGKEMHH